MSDSHRKREFLSYKRKSNLLMLRMAILSNNIEIFNKYIGIYKYANIVVINNKKAKKISLAEFIIFKGTAEMIKGLFSKFTRINEMLIYEKILFLEDELKIYELLNVVRRFSSNLPTYIVCIMLLKLKINILPIILSLEFTYNKEQVKKDLEIFHKRHPNKTLALNILQ
jgi:hypothetical protein